MQQPPLVRSIGQFVQRLDVGPGGIVVAVSGGPDSVALLRALLEVRPADRAWPVIGAHLNHQLRGQESDADEEFVRALFISLESRGASGLQLVTDRIDVAAQARAEHANVEDLARRLRYDWLARVATERRAQFVATGHTGDDQAETVLHRLLRGAGLRGLRGIAARRRLGPDVELVRPLLETTRQEVVAYLQARGQRSRQDRSNDDLAYTRNRIRHELLPHLAERYNPAIRDVLCRLATQAEPVYQEVESQARALLARAERPRAGPLVIVDRQSLAAVPRHLMREVLHLVWEREGWPLGPMGFEDWDRLAAVAGGEIAAVDLPGGIRARCCERVVQLGTFS